ncbi:MAG TPA: TonB family protein [Pyrinomonadaceae bacterium]|nr:TonB family protein [Pyrinomonadaceae bacterium]
MEKHLTRLFFVFALVFVCTAVGNGQDRDVKAMPALSIPDAAAAEGLYGTMLVEVKVDDKGKVKDIKQIIGPDWTCPNYESPGLIELRKYVEKQAKIVTFEPRDKDGKVDESTHWVEFKFVDSTPPGSAKVGAKVISFGRKPINGGVLNGKAIELVQPRYPEAARAVRASGAVKIDILISEKGKIISAEAISGHPLLVASARAAACSSRFSPTTLSGDPVKVRGVIVYVFKL